jgi:hypothetical protein
MIPPTGVATRRNESPDPMNTPKTDRDAIAAVIAAMQHYDTAWHRELAEYLTADGDIDEARHDEYERAKDDHAWPVLERLPDFIAALRAAIGDTDPATAPETAP